MDEWSDENGRRCEKQESEGMVYGHKSEAVSLGILTMSLY